MHESTLNSLRFMSVATLVLMWIASSGCAVVKQADREYLSDPIMIFDENPIETGIDEHAHDYREGSVGGTGAQAGGCGCG